MSYASSPLRSATPCSDPLGVPNSAGAHSPLLALDAPPSSGQTTAPKAPTLCETLVAVTKADLRNANLVSAVGSGK